MSGDPVRLNYTPVQTYTSPDAGECTPEAPPVSTPAQAPICLPDDAPEDVLECRPSATPAAPSTPSPAAGLSQPPPASAVRQTTPQARPAPNPEVKQEQYQLLALGHSVGRYGADGVDGAATREAREAFEASGISAEEATRQAEQTTLNAQANLAALGYHLGTTGADGNGVDGQFGPRTRAAVMRFQRESRIEPAHGQLDATTTDALRNARMARLDASITPEQRQQARDAYDAGQAAFNAGNYGQALEHFERCDQIAPEQPGVRAAIAACRGQLESAGQ